MYEAGDILQGRIVQPFDFIQQPVVQKFTHLLKGGVYLPKIPQKSGFGIGLAPKCHLDIKRMAVEAPVLTGAYFQMVGGVEAEALG